MSTVDGAEPQHHDPTFRCSPWTLTQEVDPAGSAPRFDALVLVEWPLPWPNDVADIPELATAASHVGVRLMVVVPHDDTSTEGLARVVHRRRTGLNRLTGVDHVVPGAERVELAERLAAHAHSDSSAWPSAVGASPPEVLVCAHGRRDACCGRWGTLLNVELAAGDHGARVWRCSHTGGHRFAPTAVTLPDGRAWAWADAALLESVVQRRSDVAAVSGHDRGTSSLAPPLQALERAVLAELGWTWLDEHEVEGTLLTGEAGQPDVAELRWPTGWARARVAVIREVPVLVCGAPPESATKSSAEYAVTDLQIGR